MTQKQIALELIPEYERKTAMLKLQERYLQRKVMVVTDRTWQINLGQVQAQLRASEDYLTYLNEICNESSESEYADKARQADTLKKR